MFQLGIVSLFKCVFVMFVNIRMLQPLKSNPFEESQGWIGRIWDSDLPCKIFSFGLIKGINLKFPLDYLKQWTFEEGQMVLLNKKNVLLVGAEPEEILNKLVLSRELIKGNKKDKYITEVVLHFLFNFKKSSCLILMHLPLWSFHFQKQPVNVMIISIIKTLLWINEWCFLMGFV